MSIVHEAYTVVMAGPIGKVCPQAPPGAQAPIDQIRGYVLWGVLILIAIAVFVAIGSIVAGRVFGMPHASKGGMVSIVILFAAGIGYMVLPGMIAALTGSGCA
jgi:hypothetical protein